MSLNHQHLRTFHAVAVDGSISRAARRLAVSQPTLSQQLRALELRHKVTLFESRKPPMRLTPAGRELFTLARNLFSVSGQIEELLGEAVYGEVSELRLGSDSPVYAARLVAGYHAIHPKARVHVRIGNAREVAAWLKDAQVDAAIASDPPGDDAYSYQLLYRDQLVAALPCGHPLAAVAPAPIETFAGERLLLREPTSRTRMATEQLFAAAGVLPGETIEFHTREAIREAIALGLGVSFFYSAECPPDKRIAYQPIESPVPTPCFTGYVLCLAERRRTPLIRALFAVTAELAKDSPLPL